MGGARGKTEIGGEREVGKVLLAAVARVKGIAFFREGFYYPLKNAAYGVGEIPSYVGLSLEYKRVVMLWTERGEVGSAYKVVQTRFATGYVCCFNGVLGFGSLVIGEAPESVSCACGKKVAAKGESSLVVGG